MVKERTNDPKTKYQVVSMFRDISKQIKYRIPTPPIDISEDRHKFKCPTCETLFDSDDVAEDFNVCYICGQVWKEEDSCQ